MRFLLLPIVLLACPAYSWELGTLDHLSIDVAKFGCNREPMTPDIPCENYKGRVRLNFNLGLFNDLVKWKNDFHGEGTDAKFETLGWHYVMYVPTILGIEPFYEHHSMHVMDRVQPTVTGRNRPERFPVEDSYGLRVIFFNRETK